jgi:hypothetical protein
VFEKNNGKKYIFKKIAPNNDHDIGHVCPGGVVSSQLEILWVVRSNLARV